MKILIITQYFYPEPGATPNRILSFARYFARKGHDVTVLCGFPNYPSGKLSMEYRYKLIKKERLDNFSVLRVFIVPTARSNIFTRLLNYSSFLISSILAGLLIRRHDVIIASSPPPSVGLAASVISIVKRVPLIGDIQDLWPEYAIATGRLKNRILIFICRLVETVFYQSCRALVTISNGLKDYLQQKVSSEKQISIVRNGTAFPDMQEFSSRQASCFEMESINVCYAGVIGLLQPIEDIIEAAAITAGDDSIRYTLIGDGVRRVFFEQQALSRGMTNVHFTGAISQEDTIEMLLKADIGIVTLVEIEQFKSALPSKFFDYMAVGLPVIMGVDGEARKILEENNSGLYYKPRCPQDLVAKIHWLKANPDKARIMGRAGRKLAFSSYSRSMLAAEMEKFIVELFKADKK